MFCFYVEIKCQLDATDELHLVAILFPHIIEDARLKPHQIQVFYFFEVCHPRCVVTNGLNPLISNNTTY
jgi:hypothetical protein